jgi:hypothetical protein
MIQVEEALKQLGYDYTDATVLAIGTRKLAAAEKRLRRAVGDDIWILLPDDPEAMDLLMFYLEESFNEQGVTSAKVSNAKRAAVVDAELHLRLELARLREEANA